MNIHYSLEAAHELSGLQKHIQNRIAHKMRHYAGQRNPLIFAKKLALSDLYRFRIGNYRLLFKIENAKILVIAIRKRDTAYRRIGLD